MNFITKIDHYIFFLINNAPGSRAFDDFAFSVTTLGEWGIALIAFAFIAETGRRTFFLHFTVMMLVLVIFIPTLHTIKSKVDRQRPAAYFEEEVASEKVFVRVLGRKLKKHSFPSGHSATAFYFMTYVSLFKRSYCLFSMTLAALIAMSRIYVGAHFPLDCFFGGFYGIAGGACAWLCFSKIDNIIRLRRIADP